MTEGSLYECEDKSFVLLYLARDEFGNARPGTLAVSAKDGLRCTTLAKQCDIGGLHDLFTRLFRK